MVNETCKNDPYFYQACTVQAHVFPEMPYSSTTKSFQFLPGMVGKVFGGGSKLGFTKSQLPLFSNCLDSTKIKCKILKNFEITNK